MSIEETRLEQLLRDTYSAVGETVDAPAPSITFLASAPAPKATRRPSVVRHRGALAACAAFTAIIVVVAAAVFALRVSPHSSNRHPSLGGASGAGVSPTLGPIFPTYPTHTGAPLLLAPSYVPDGFHLVVSTDRQGGTSISGSPGGTIQFWVRLDDTQQRPLASFTLSWGPADLGEAAKQSGISDAERAMFHGDALDTFRSQSIPATIAGHDGLYSAQSNTLAWEQDHQLVTVSGGIDSWVGQWPDHISREDLENIAEHLVRAPDGRYTLTEPPAGFQLSGEQPSYASDGSNPRVLAYSDGANHGFAIQLVDDTQQPPGVKLAYPPGRLTMIRGQRAVLTPFLNGGPGCTAPDAFLCTGLPPDLSHLSLIWIEPDNTRIVVTSVGVTQTQLIDIAQGLQTVQPSNWPQIGNPPQ